MRKLLSVVALVVLIFGVTFSAFAMPNQTIRELSNIEKVEIIGGTSVVKAVSNTANSICYVPPNDDFKVRLQNVPYFAQDSSFLKENTKINNHSYRSDYYCGLASCMMVRYMGSDIDSSNCLIDLNHGPQFTVGNYMISLDKQLNDVNRSQVFNMEYYEAPDGKGHKVFDWNEYLDIIQKGLLINKSWVDGSNNYNTTKELLYSLYMKNGFKNINYNSNYYIMNRSNNYSSITVKYADVETAKSDIWNHVKNNKKPAVIIVDSKRTDDLINSYTFGSMTANPVLHYNVIVGAEKKDGNEYFYVHDPLSHIGKANKFKTNDYVCAAKVNNRVSPAWIYQIANGKCYYMLVN